MAILEKHLPTDSASIPWWRWLVTFVAGIVIWMLAGLVAGIVGAVVAGEGSEVIGNPVPMVVYAIIRTAVVVIGIRYVWRIVQGGWQSIGFVSEGWKRDALYGALAGLAFALVQFFILLPVTGGAERSDVVASAEVMGTSLSSLIAAIIFGWLIGAVSEEVFYRGHLIRSLMNTLGGQTWALVISSIVSIALFSYGHAYLGPIGLANAALVGTFYTALFIWRGRLMTGIVAHGVYNTLAFSAIFFVLT